MRTLIPSLSLISVLLALPAPALAYIGPGAGLGAIGVLVAVVVAVLLIFIGFIWFPLRRMLRKRRATADERADASSSNDS